MVPLSKVRVYELAKETGLSNKEVLERLGDMDIAAKSHSSSVSQGDALRFRESLGKAKEEREQAELERARKEAEEYERAMNEAKPKERTANRILPPHLRKAQESEESEQPAAAPARALRPPVQAFKPSDGGSATVGGEAASPRPASTPPPSGAPDRPAGPPPARPATPPARPADSPARPAAASTGESAAPTPTPSPVGKPLDPRQAAAIARQGVVYRPNEKPQERPAARAPQETEETEGEATVAPGTATSGPPRPGESTIPARMLRGAAVEPRRRVETKLPQEGDGKRSIPPPLKAAPKGGPSRPGGAPGRPGGGPGRPGGGRPGGAPGRGKGRKGRRGELSPQEQFERDNRPRRGRKQKEAVKAAVEGPVDIVPGITVNEFAKAIGVSPASIVGVLFRMGEMITVTQTMSNDLIELVAAEMDAEINFIEADDLFFDEIEEDDPDDLVDRPPVVTVMGHVDHGKTLLLDSIRNADVVSGESGGITQHIGAYQVTREGRKITFIDTPGHEAFSAMRARGASVTDVAILVVAADDGVKPQTVEAIDHIKEAEVPLIVAVNKIDKENADPVRVRTQLTEYELIAEEFGGQTTFVDVSAMTGQNLDELLDLILLQADVEETKANPDREAMGTVIEANLDRGRGAVATVLVQNGTLNVGDNLVAGVASCKVRAMFDDTGERVETAEPAKPVQVLGWSDVPDAGDDFRVVEDERTARDIAEDRASRARKEELANRPRLTLEGLGTAVQEGQLSMLNLVIKGDVSGTVEAVAAEMDKLDLEGVRTRIVRKGVGAVTNDDVNLAVTSDAIIIAFNVRPESSAREAIEESGVDLRQYSIIYKAIEDITNAVKGLLAPEFEEVVVGRAEVREIFKVPRAGFVFGSYVTEGTLKRNAQVRVIRDSTVVADDTIASLRRFKDDVTEVRENFECGVGLDKFQDIKVGDEFEVYEEREIARD
ncbi:translation initiation factor IF-2 [Euzebya tangerina]|uniref:translation initiation factor IF-2 n=1 Tax=Euzebya tangerina TaxID=591198 RepID=UPI002F2F35F3